MKINRPVTDKEQVIRDGAILASRTDLKGIITYANKAFIEISGFSKDELIGENHNVVRHPDMPPAAFEDLWNTVKKGKPWLGIVKNRCKNGDFYWVKATVSPVVENGEIVEYMSVRTKPTKQQIEDSEALYHKVNTGIGSLKQGRFKRILYKIRSAPIAWRLSLASMSLVLLVSGLFAATGYWKVTELVGDNEFLTLSKIHRNVMEKIESESRLATALATLVAELPDTKTAFNQGDRVRLLGLFQDAFVKLKKEYGLRQFQFHKAPAISYLRIHKPEKYGDDLSAFRKTVVKVNTDHVVVTGLELGDAGLGIRGVVPVMFGERYLGSVEFGMSFDQTLFDEIKKVYDVDITLLLQEGSGYKIYATTLDTPLKLSAEDEKKLSNGELVLQHIEHDGRRYAVFDESVEDFSGKKIGLLEIAMDRSAFISAMTTIGYFFTLLLGLAVFAGFGLTLIISRSIANPLSKAVDIALSISQGNYDNDIIIEREDETGRLLSAMLTMQSRLGYDLHEVNEAVTENLRIKVALENVSSCVTLSDKSNQLIFINKAGYKLFEKLADNIIDGVTKFNVHSLNGTNIIS